MATAGALEDQELMSEGKNLSLQGCSSLKRLASRRKQRENDRHHVAEKLQRRLPKFNQFNQNGVFGRDKGQDVKKNTSAASAATEGWGRSGIGGGNQLILDGHPACF